MKNTVGKSMLLCRGALFLCGGDECPAAGFALRNGGIGGYRRILRGSAFGKRFPRERQRFPGGAGDGAFRSAGDTRCDACFVIVVPEGTSELHLRDDGEPSGGGFPCSLPDAFSECRVSGEGNARVFLECRGEDLRAGCRVPVCEQHEFSR